MEPRPLLCDTEAILTAALPILQECSTLTLDCEALRLGERGGSLSLITLRTTEPSPIRTYIIDAVRLPRSALQPIFDILSSPNVLKVVFDGRMDYSAIYHGYEVELKNVLDIQLVDVASRQRRGEGQFGQFRRLRKYLRYVNFNMNVEMYQRLHKLSGLNECIEEHVLFSNASRGWRGSGMAYCNSPHSLMLISVSPLVDHTRWLLRPLPQSYLTYASEDVALIHALYEKFTQSNYVDPSLLSQSEAYVSIWKTHQPAASDRHVRHPLLPLGILDPPNASSTTVPCMVCGRELTRDAFPPRGWQFPAERKCWVCRAVSARV
jgi:exonuclease 3'-5' domain-containing protein 1